MAPVLELRQRNTVMLGCAPAHSSTDARRGQTLGTEGRGLKALLTFSDAADHFAVKHLAVLIEDEPQDTEQEMRLRGVARTDASGN